MADHAAGMQRDVKVLRKQTQSVLVMGVSYEERLVTPDVALLLHGYLLRITSTMGKSSECRERASLYLGIKWAKAGLALQLMVASGQTRRYFSWAQTLRPKAKHLHC